MRSPHVVALLSYLEGGDSTGCLVMELLPGGDLYSQVLERYGHNQETDGYSERDGKGAAGSTTPAGVPPHILRPPTRSSLALTSLALTSLALTSLSLTSPCTHLPCMARWSVCAILRMALAGLAAIHDHHVVHDHSYRCWCSAACTLG